MRANSTGGFTLIEIVIGMTLSIVIMLILFAGLRLGYRSQEKGIDKAEMSQKERILYDTITWLLRGTYPYVIKKGDSHKIFFDGLPDSAGFVTTSVDRYGQGPADRAGLKWVSIFADEAGLKIREKVFFLEDVFDRDGGTLYTLDPDVRELSFEYYDLPEDEKNGAWVSSWDPDEKEYFPAAVKIRITYSKGGRRVDLPEVIVRINIQRTIKNR